VLFWRCSVELESGALHGTFSQSLLAVAAVACLFAVAATVLLDPSGVSRNASTHLPLRSRLCHCSAVSGNLGLRRFARHARRDGRILAQQTRCLPGSRGKGLRSHSRWQSLPAVAASFASIGLAREVWQQHFSVRLSLPVAPSIFRASRAPPRSCLA